MTLLTSNNIDIEINNLKEKLERLEFEKKFNNRDDWFNEVKAGNFENVKKMIEYKIITDIDCNEFYIGYSALILASTKGHIDIVKFLIENGAKINFQAHHGDSALMRASGNGHIDIVKLLIENKANIDLHSKDGKNALMYASENDHKDIVKLLEDYKSNHSYENVVSGNFEEDDTYNNNIIKKMMNDALSSDQPSIVIKFISSYLN